jgi:short-subunit dehydrogenase
MVVAQTFLQNGYRVMIVGRDQQRLDEATDRLRSESSDTVASISANLASLPEAHRVTQAVKTRFQRLDVLVNCVGLSDRGLIEQLESETLEELFRQNVTTALHCCQASLPMLEDSGGVIVNIGSLASKVGARYIGGYSAAKHALAGMTQQLRLELRPKGIHVGLVNPGPIQRDDAGQRYEKQISDDLPEQARKPGGGTSVKGIPPQRVADAVMTCVTKRKPDIVLPGHMRILIALGHAFPRLGDWLLLKFTSSK